MSFFEGQISAGHGSGEGASHRPPKFNEKATPRDEERMKIVAGEEKTKFWAVRRRGNPAEGAVRGERRSAEGGPWEAGPGEGGSWGGDVLGMGCPGVGVTWVFCGEGRGEERGQGNPNIGQTQKFAKHIKTLILVKLAKNVGLAKVRLAKLGFVQTWP